MIDYRTGDHSPNAYLFSNRPLVTDENATGEISVYDVAPTICRALGARMPGASGRARHASR